MLHPYLFNRLPDRDAIKRGIKNNEIVTLEGLLEKQLDNLGLILELKSGIGDVYKVFERMLALLGSCWREILDRYFLSPIA